MTESVPHADHVERANVVNHADTTAHVDNVERLDTHDDQPTNVANVQNMNVQSSSKWRAIADLGGIVTVLAALGITWLTLSAYSTETTKNRRLIENIAHTDRNIDARRTCQALYQDAVDAANTLTLSTIGDLVVIISTVVPGPEREAAVQDNIAKLRTVANTARVAVAAKVAYNTAGGPLPCPIAPA